MPSCWRQRFSWKWLRRLFRRRRNRPRRAARTRASQMSSRCRCLRREAVKAVFERGGKARAQRIKTETQQSIWRKADVETIKAAGSVRKHFSLQRQFCLNFYTENKLTSLATSVRFVGGGLVPHEPRDVTDLGVRAEQEFAHRSELEMR